MRPLTITVANDDGVEDEVRPVKITIEGTNEKGEPVMLVFDVDGDSVSMDMDREFIERGVATEIVEKHCVRWEYRFWQKTPGTLLPGGIFIKGR